MTGMEENWEGRPSYEPKPHTYSLALALVVVAVTFSYLVCFAMVRALQKYEVMDLFPGNYDPRPRWFLICCGSLTLLFLGVFGLTRLRSHRKLDEDELAIDEVTPLKRDVPPPTQTPEAPDATDAPEAPEAPK